MSDTTKQNTKRLAAAAFAEYDAIPKDQTPMCVEDAEYRWLVCESVSIRARRRLTWEETQREYENVRSESCAVNHRCGKKAVCDPLSLKRGQEFFDPAFKTGRLTASGDVWVCSVSLLKHTCPHHAICEFSEKTTESTSVCSMTGINKGGIAMIVSEFATRAQVQAATQNMLEETCHSLAKRRCARPVGKQPTAPKKRTRTSAMPWETIAQKLDENPSVQMQTDVRAVCETLFGTNGIARSCCAALVQVSKDLDTELGRLIAQKNPIGFVEIASLVVAQSRQPLAAVAEVTRRANPFSPLSLATVDYLVGAIARLLYVFRLTPNMTAGDNASSASGATTRTMVAPLLIAMRDGMIATVRSVDGTPEICVASQKQTDVDAIWKQGTIVKQCVFTPAHPWLEDLIPKIMPPGMSRDISQYFDNMMSQQRKLQSGLSSAVSDPYVVLSRYTLGHYITPKVDRSALTPV